MSEKIKVLVISDHPFSPSGVGTQTRYIIEGLLETGEYALVYDRSKILWMALGDRR